MWSSVSFFNFQYLLFSLRLFSSCLHFLPCLLVTATFPPIFPLVTRFRRQFLHKKWPIQLSTLSFSVCRVFLLSLTTVILNFSHYRSKWFFPSFFSISLQNVLVVSDPFWEVSKLQHHKKCPSYSTIQSVQVITPYKVSKLQHHTKCPSYITIQSVQVKAPYKVSKLQHRTKGPSYSTVRSVQVTAPYKVSKLQHHTKCPSYSTIKRFLQK